MQTKERKRRALPAALLVASALAFGAAGAEAKETIIIAIPGLPQGVDLDKHIGPQTWTMGAQLFSSGLEWAMGPYPYATGATFDPDKLADYEYPIGYSTGETVPGSMESCELSADGLTATYHLRKGVVSAYGNEFTADDVVWRYQREKDRPIIYALISRLLNTDTATVTKVDDYTVTLANASPMPLACSGLTNFYNPWLDSKEVAKHKTDADPYSDEWISTHGGGFGPYFVAEWTPGKRVVMKANPNYWRGEPAIKQIIYLVVPESSGRLALLQRGEIDLAEGLSPDEIASLSGDAKAKGIAIRGNQQMWLTLNNDVAPFNDVRVRQAIEYVIPRQQIVDAIYKGMAVPWSGVISSVTPGYVNEVPYEDNLDKAKQLVAEAGLAPGTTVELAFSAGVPEMENMAVVLKDALAKIGINLDLKKLPVAAHSDLVQSRKAPMALWTDSPIQPDSNYVMNLVYSSGPLALVNYSNFKDPEVDRLIEEGKTIVDPAARIEFHKQIQKRIQEEAAFGWTVEPYYRVGLSGALTGFRWYPTQYYRVDLMKFAD